MKSFHFTSFGCKVNRYDGQQIVEELERASWTPAGKVEDADLVVVNCCVVTGRSAGRCRRYVKSAARRNGHAPLLVTGCLTPDDAGTLESINPRIRAAEPGKGLDLVLDFLSARSRQQGVHGLAGRTRAYVKVQDGCDLACSYCIIPSIRGPSRSRPPEEILLEVRRLLEAGYSELVLCGIRLGGYRWDGVRLEDLLDRILREERGPCRIRLSSLNPAEVTERLLEVMAGDGRVARHLHLPLQSGDDATLHRMRRPYTVDGYFRKLERVRLALPDPAVSTDFMVGFPGEDEKAFQRSLRALKETGASRVHVFPYSRRDGTEAASRPQVPDREKTERAARARSAAARLKEEFDRRFLDSEALVLVEGTAPPFQGLTSRYQKTVLGTPAGNGAAKPAAGAFVRVLLESYDRGVFTGRSKSEEKGTT